MTAINAAISVNPIGNVDDHFSLGINHIGRHSTSLNFQPTGYFVFLVPEPVESISLRGLPVLQMEDNIRLRVPAAGVVGRLRALRVPWIPGEASPGCLRNETKGNDQIEIVYADRIGNRCSWSVVNRKLGHGTNGISILDIP